MYLQIDLLEELKQNGFCFESWNYTDCVSIKKGYDIINHAYELYKYDSNSYNEDIISNLRKALNLRTSDIKSRFGMEKIDTFKKNKTFDNLERLGIVKSFLLKNLVELRNDIEYRGQQAPNHDKCKELTDIVWYFYRSTDAYVKMFSNKCLIEYKIDEIEYWMMLTFDFDNHEFLKVCGRFPNGFVSEEKTNQKCLKLYDFEKKECKKDVHDKTKMGDVFYSGNIKVCEIKDYLEILNLVFLHWGL